MTSTSTPDLCAQEQRSGATITNLQILIFNIMGVYFAADTEQVARVESFHPPLDETKNITHFHEEFLFPEGPVTYDSPRVLYIKNGRGIVIDHLEEVRSLPLEQIRTLPELLVQARKPDAIWGVGLVDDKVILLLDFFT